MWLDGGGLPVALAFFLAWAFGVWIFLAWVFGSDAEFAAPGFFSDVLNFPGPFANPSWP